MIATHTTYQRKVNSKNSSHAGYDIPRSGIQTKFLEEKDELLKKCGILEADLVEKKSEIEELENYIIKIEKENDDDKKIKQELGTVGESVNENFRAMKEIIELQSGVIKRLKRRREGSTLEGTRKRRFYNYENIL